MLYAKTSIRIALLCLALAIIWNVGAVQIQSNTTLSIFDNSTSVGTREKRQLFNSYQLFPGIYFMLQNALGNFRPPSVFNFLKTHIRNKLVNSKLVKVVSTTTTAKPTCASVGGTTCYSPLAYGLCVVQPAIGVRNLINFNIKDYCSQFANGLGTVYSGPVPLTRPTGVFVRLTGTAGDVKSYLKCLGFKFTTPIGIQIIQIGLASGGRCTNLVLLANANEYTINTIPCTAPPNSAALSAPVCVYDV